MLVGLKKRCRECTEVYAVTRDWQLFCSDKCRLRFNRRQHGTCFYCGQFGAHRHHVNPRAYSGKQWFKGVECVFCCTECNVALADRFFSDTVGAITFLVDLYVKRYALDESVVRWDDDEVEELGRVLRSYVKKKLEDRRKAEERAVYLQAMRFYLASDYDELG
jgi:hypothetical protein